MHCTEGLALCGIRKIRGVFYSAHWVTEQLQLPSIYYLKTKTNRSEIYLDALSRMTSRKVISSKGYFVYAFQLVIL